MEKRKFSLIFPIYIILLLFGATLIVDGILLDRKQKSIDQLNNDVSLLRSDIYCLRERIEIESAISPLTFHDIATARSTGFRWWGSPPETLSIDPIQDSVSLLRQLIHDAYFDIDSVVGVISPLKMKIDTLRIDTVGWDGIKLENTLVEYEDGTCRYVESEWDVFPILQATTDTTYYLTKEQIIKLNEE